MDNSTFFKCLLLIVVLLAGILWIVKSVTFNVVGQISEVEENTRLGYGKDGNPVSIHLS